MSSCGPSSFLFFKFGELGGFTAIQEKLNTDEIEIAVSATALTFICFRLPTGAPTYL